MVSMRTYQGRSTFIHKARNLLRAHVPHVMIPHFSSDGSTIAEVPESLMFTTKWLSDVSQMYPHIHALHHSSETPIHSSSGPAANALSSESNTHRATPPFEAHTPMRLMPTNANTIIYSSRTIDSTSNIRSCIFSSTILRSANAV